MATAHWKNTQCFSSRLATWHYWEHQPLACCCVWLELLSCLIAWFCNWSFIDERFIVFHWFNFSAHNKFSYATVIPPYATVILKIKHFPFAGYWCPSSSWAWIVESYCRHWFHKEQWVDRLALTDYLFVLLLNAIVRCNASLTDANDIFFIIREILLPWT